MKITTLWEHPNFKDISNYPEFTPQTLTIANINDYDIIGICHSCYDRERSRFNFVPNVQNKEQLLDVTWHTNTSGFEFCGYHRNFTLTNSGISFGDGYLVRSSSVNRNNLFAIPIKIVGIKLT